MTMGKIGVVGAGRMGRGIALNYLFSGVPVVLVDLKKRTESQREQLQADVRADVLQDLQLMVEMGLIAASATDAVLDGLSFGQREDSTCPLADCEVVFEGVPEIRGAKRDALQYLSSQVSDEAVIASTTSTFLVTELATFVSKPSRFVNAHWLNPAHLMPLVEVSRSDHTDDAVVTALKHSLESIGKVPVVCGPTAGYIVPRIQALAMNEAARLVEEGVASAEDVDKAVNIGFGLRFAVLGLLEFIDWGGGDILFYASQYLQRELGPRFTVPDIVKTNMQQARNGLRDGVGFFDYGGVDVNNYRKQRIGKLVSLLADRGLLPQHPSVLNAGEKR